MVKIIWTNKALLHLDSIAEYIELTSLVQAKRIEKLIFTQVKLLEDNIRIGRKIPELNEDKYRELFVFSYRILYKIINDNRVDIIGIIHGRKLFPTNYNN